MSIGALDIIEKLFPQSTEEMRQSRILNTAQDVMPCYFREAIQKTSANLASYPSTAEDADAAWNALIDDLESEMRRRAS